MGTLTSILLTDEAYQVVQEYIDKNNCSRNKAVNELIKEVGKELDLDTKRSKATLKVSLEINEKLNELKAILTNKNEVKNNETNRTNWNIE